MRLIPTVWKPLHHNGTESRGYRDMLSLVSAWARQALYRHRLFAPPPPSSVSVSFGAVVYVSVLCTLKNSKCVCHEATQARLTLSTAHFCTLDVCVQPRLRHNQKSRRVVVCVRLSPLPSPRSLSPLPSPLSVPKNPENRSCQNRFYSALKCRIGRAAYLPACTAYKEVG